MIMLELHKANVARDKEWNVGSEKVTLSFRACELAGEVGEACNIIKKLERERIGIRGSRSTLEKLAEELADVIICTDLIAMHIGALIEPINNLTWLKNKSLASLGASMAAAAGMVCHVCEDANKAPLVPMMETLVQRTELIARSQKIDLGAAVRNKFNATSEKQNLATRIT